MTDTTVRYRAARDQLHTMVEWLLAGPQFARSGTIRLQVAANQIMTVADPAIGLSERGLTVFGQTHRLAGTIAEVGAAAGLEVCRPAVQYQDPVPGGPDTELDAEPAAIADVIAVFTTGLPAFATIGNELPVLWPEHFDLGVSLDGVNYGVSPGDTYSAGPYAYIGPETHGDDPFWNAPFGAALPFDPKDGSASGRIIDFFTEGGERARGERKQ